MSLTNKKLTINAISAIIQVSFTAVIFFFLYKYLLKNLGIIQLGVWSLILSFSSIANLANFGITSGLVKFVAEYIGKKEEGKIGKLILTSFLSMAVLFSLLSLLILFGAQYFLHFVIDKQFLSVALSILPLSLGSLCINAVSGVFTSVLEGFQKNYLRNFIYVFSGIIMFIATVLLTPVYHLQGVAIAQLIQAIFVLFVALILINRVSPFNSFAYWRWSNQTFRELFNYGYKFQVISICQLLYEPTTKLLLSKFGGLALLGNYEMASRFVSQFRSLLVNANQVVIPVVAEKIITQTKTHLQEFYANMSRILLLFTLPLSTLLILLAPFISFIWLGHVESNFVIFVYILTISYIINIMSGPAYFSCMAEGRLNILIFSHVSIAIINLTFGYLLGANYGGYGIIIAWGLALIVGSIITIYSYEKRIEISMIQIFDKYDWQIVISSNVLISFGIVLFSFNYFAMNEYLKALAIIVIYTTIYFIVLRKNGLIKDVFTFLIKSEVSRNSKLKIN